MRLSDWRARAKPRKHDAVPAMSPATRPDLPGPAVHPIRRTIRYVLSRLIATAIVRAIFRVRLEGRDRLPAGQYLLCFTHENWVDPFVLMAVLPWRPRLYFFGPKEEDMSAGGRNRLMSWTGNTVPYRPGKNDLLDATRRVQTVFAAGGVLAIAGEGRIHAHEDEVLPISEGAAYFAMRANVPIVPLAINGLTWYSVGSRVRIRIGEPIQASGRPTREAVEALTAATWTALTALVAAYPQPKPPGRFGRWLTEVFNDWPEGARPT
jgi:1-acyl-sn-glycerol-3-phosphate acyltransferase